jgi:RND family efflux transporter MFP subunit
VVTARNYDNGDMYSGQPILTIEQLNPVKLLINISEIYYKDVVEGMPVEIELDAYPDEVFGGKVSIVYPTVDQTTHTFPVEVTVPNSNQRVRPGMFARATINFEEIERVMIPDMAIVKQVGAGDRYVYIYKDGKVTYSKIELGKHMGDRYEVKSGVEPNAQVVVAGMSRLSNGKEVIVAK